MSTEPPHRQSCPAVLPWSHIETGAEGRGPLFIIFYFLFEGSYYSIFLKNLINVFYFLISICLQYRIVMFV